MLKFNAPAKGRLLSAQRGSYEFISEALARDDKDRQLFGGMALTFDTSNKNGFCLLISIAEGRQNHFRYVNRALLELGVDQFEYLERFKILNSALANSDQPEIYQYFVALRIKVQRGVTINAVEVKEQILENQSTQQFLIALLSRAEEMCHPVFNKLVEQKKHEINNN